MRPCKGPSRRDETHPALHERVNVPHFLRSARDLGSRCGGRRLRSSGVASLTPLQAARRASRHTSDDRAVAATMTRAASIGALANAEKNSTRRSRSRTPCTPASTCTPAPGGQTIKDEKVGLFEPGPSAEPLPRAALEAAVPRLRPRRARCRFHGWARTRPVEPRACRTPQRHPAACPTACAEA